MESLLKGVQDEEVVAARAALRQLVLEHHARVAEHHVHLGLGVGQVAEVPRRAREADHVGVDLVEAQVVAGLPVGGQHADPDPMIPMRRAGREPPRVVGDGAADAAVAREVGYRLGPVGGVLVLGAVDDAAVAHRVLDERAALGALDLDHPVEAPRLVQEAVPGLPWRSITSATSTSRTEAAASLGSVELPRRPRAWGWWRSRDPGPRMHRSNSK
jgi:hypothetical protein